MAKLEASASEDSSFLAAEVQNLMDERQALKTQVQQLEREREFLVQENRLLRQSLEGAPGWKGCHTEQRQGQPALSVHWLHSMSWPGGVKERWCRRSNNEPTCSAAAHACSPAGEGGEEVLSAARLQEELRAEQQRCLVLENEAIQLRARVSALERASQVGGLACG